MVKTLLRALIGLLAAAAFMAGGMTVATAKPVAQDYVAAGVTGTPAADGLVIAMLLAFAFGWVAVELRRSSH